MDILKSLRMIDNETVEIVYHDNINVELEFMQSAWIKLDDFTEKKPLKKLILLGKNTQMTHEARKNGHSEGHARKHIIRAEAIVVHSLPQKMAANFYSRFIKDLYPIKYFTEVNEAKKWLEAI